jgi:hypothetical protein
VSAPHQDARRHPSRSPGRPPIHGLHRLRAAVRELGDRVIDRRTALGKALAQWRAELVDDLGGSDAVSTQEAAIVNLAVRTKLMLDSLDTWLLTQSSLVNRRTRSVIPAVIQRQQLADALAKYLVMLGLRRRPRPTLDLPEYIAERYQQRRTVDTDVSKAPETPGDPRRSDSGTRA